MTEREVLDKLRAKIRLPKGSPVILGIGDDCAIYRPRGAREDLLFTTDMVIEDVHFRRATHPAPAVGYRTLARGLSDIAAMGGEPRFCLLSLAVAPGIDAKWIDAFYRGFLALANRYATPLAGGDLSHSDRVTCDIVVAGAVPHGSALRRDGARVGDAIYVSGTLGGSALGLDTNTGPAWKRHLRPEPRLGLGRFLRGRASAAMDLSDGLSLDLLRLCRESGVAASVDWPLPVFPGASLEQALDGGEDYELLFTAPPRAKIPEVFERIPISRIGSITKGKPGAVLFFGRPLAPLGYDHFQ